MIRRLKGGVSAFAGRRLKGGCCIGWLRVRAAGFRRRVSPAALAVAAGQLGDRLALRHEAAAAEPDLLDRAAVPALAAHRLATTMAGNAFAAEARTLDRLGLGGMDVGQIRRTLDEGFR